MFSFLLPSNTLHWSISTLLKSISIPLVPLKRNKKYIMFLFQIKYNRDAYNNTWLLLFQNRKKSLRYMIKWLNSLKNNVFLNIKHYLIISLDISRLVTNNSDIIHVYILNVYFHTSFFFFHLFDTFLLKCFF